MTNLYYFEELPEEAQKMAVAFFQDQMRDDPVGYDLSQAEAEIMAGHYLLDVCGHPVLHVSDYKKEPPKRNWGGNNKPIRRLYHDKCK